MLLSWLKILLSELGHVPKKQTLLFCDNTAVIKIANNPIQHDRTKHTEPNKNYIKDNLDFGVVEIPCIKSADQPTDILNHVITTDHFHMSLSKLGICDPRES